MIFLEVALVSCCPDACHDQLLFFPDPQATWTCWKGTRKERVLEVERLLPRSPCSIKLGFQRVVDWWLGFITSDFLSQEM
jgi:hypothetical protein